MDNKIEEMKKIIKENKRWTFGSEEVEELARRIYQLFEPKPDESRLLTDEEIAQTYIGKEYYPTAHDGELAKTQDTKTASIYQDKIQELFNKIETISLLGDVGGKVVILHKEWQGLKDEYLKK